LQNVDLGELALGKVEFDAQAVAFLLKGLKLLLLEVQLLLAGFELLAQLAFAAEALLGSLDRAPQGFEGGTGFAGWVPHRIALSGQNSHPYGGDGVQGHGFESGQLVGHHLEVGRWIRLSVEVWISYRGCGSTDSLAVFLGAEGALRDGGPSATSRGHGIQQSRKLGLGFCETNGSHGQLLIQSVMPPGLSISSMPRARSASRI